MKGTQIEMVLAERKLTRTIISALTLTGTSYQWLNNVSNTWITGKNGEPDIELNVKALSWERTGETRTLKTTQLT